MEALFVYGTLQDHNVQQQVIGRTIQSIPDALTGYKKDSVTINRRSYPILVPGSTAKEPIQGRVLLLSQEELSKTDGYETDAYQRSNVKLKSGTMAWVYLKA